MSGKYKGLTPHNDAQKADFAKTVLMPGDPLRAKFIAETFLEDAKEVNSVRGMLGYTGTYNGTRVSVMGSGMGIPSMGIYAYELFEFYDVKNIIRIGTTAGVQKETKLLDIIVAEESWSDSTYYENFFGKKATNNTLKADAHLVDLTKKTAAKLGLEDKIQVGKVYSADNFYKTDAQKAKLGQFLNNENIIGIEMESFGLYTNAEATGKRGLTILTVSDHMGTGEVTTSEERQNGFTDMMKLALDVAIELDKE